MYLLTEWDRVRQHVRPLPRDVFPIVLLRALEQGRTGHMIKHHIVLLSCHIDVEIGYDVADLSARSSTSSRRPQKRAVVSITVYSKKKYRRQGRNQERAPLKVGRIY